MEKTTLWTRVGGWFRVGGRGDGASEGLLGSSLREAEGTIVPSSGKAAARHEVSGRERLAEGFTKVVELGESIWGGRASPAMAGITRSKISEGYLRCAIW